MIDLDNVHDQIDRLHEEAEDLVAQARLLEKTQGGRGSQRLRGLARRKVQEAARLRAQTGE